MYRSPTFDHPRKRKIPVVFVTLAVVVVVTFATALHMGFRNSVPHTTLRSQSRPQGVNDVHVAHLSDKAPQAESHTPQLPPPTQLDPCHIEHNAEYSGDLVKWGGSHLKASAVECCAACKNEPKCNVWVWCGNQQGCGQNKDRKYQECWLKNQANMNLLDIQAWRGEGVAWTSGAVYEDSAKQALVAAEEHRLSALRDDPSLPLVFFDVEIQGKPIGRIKFVLFTRESPRAAENFRALCTGERGIAKQGTEGAGKPMHFKGNSFYRILDRFIDQAGANTESTFGGMFKDDAGGLKLRHNRKGLLSMANMGPDTNTSHFSILMAPAPHLDGHYTIFGEVVEGFEVAEQINALSKGKPDNHAGAEAGAVIANSGQLRCGKPCGLTASMVGVPGYVAATSGMAASL